MKQVKGLVLQVKSQPINIHKGYKFVLLLLMILLICHKCLHILIRCIFHFAVWSVGAIYWKKQDERHQHILTWLVRLMISHHTLYCSTGDDHYMKVWDVEKAWRGILWVCWPNKTWPDKRRQDIGWDCVSLQLFSLFPLSTVSSRQMFPCNDWLIIHNMDIQLYIGYQ